MTKRYLNTAPLEETPSREAPLEETPPRAKYEYDPVADGRHELDADPPPAYSERPSSVTPRTTSHSTLPEAVSLTAPSHTSNAGPSASRPLSRRMSNLSISSTSSSSSAFATSSSSSSSESDYSRSNQPPSAYEPRRPPEIWPAADISRTVNNLELPKPIAIPATSHKTGSPFLRAYPPWLEAFRISRDLFLGFVDDLNRLAVQNPPLEAVGDAVRSVPEHVTNLANASISTAARTAIEGLSNGRTEIFLREANRTIFNPRGLDCEIAHLTALAKTAGIPILDNQGKIQEDACLLPPVTDTDPGHPRTGSDGFTVPERRLKALNQFIAPLNLIESSSLEAPNNLLSRWGSRTSERDRRKSERKMERSRRKDERRAKKGGKAERKLKRQFEKEEAKLDRYIAKNQHRPEKLERKMRRFEQRKDKIEGRYEAAVDRREGRHHRERPGSKEERAMRKVLWLVVREFREPARQTPPFPSPAGIANQHYPASS